MNVSGKYRNSKELIDIHQEYYRNRAMIEATYRSVGYSYSFVEVKRSE